MPSMQPDPVWRWQGQVRRRWSHEPSFSGRGDAKSFLPCLGRRARYNEVLVEGAQPPAVLAPMFTRGLKHARDTPDDNGVASDAGGNKTQLRARRMQEEPPSGSEPVPFGREPRAKHVRFAEDSMMWEPDTHFEFDATSTLQSQADLQIDPVVAALFKESQNGYRPSMVNSVLFSLSSSSQDYNGPTARP